LVAQLHELLLRANREIRFGGRRKLVRLAQSVFDFGGGFVGFFGSGGLRVNLRNRIHAENLLHAGRDGNHDLVVGIAEERRAFEREQPDDLEVDAFDTQALADGSTLAE
jgi:hypothetical protein